MSAIPLPALPVTPAAPTRPQATHRGEPGDASFHAHLQSAQQSQPPPDNAQTGLQAPADAGAGQAGAQAKQAPGTQGKQVDQAEASQTDGGPGIDLAGGIINLAGAVLNLIGHPDGGKHAASASDAAKPAAGNKPPKIADPTAVPGAALPAIALTPIPITGTQTPSTDGAPINGIGNAWLSKTSLMLDAKGGQFSAGDAGPAGASAPADGGSSLPGDANAAPLLAAASGHMALPTLTNLPADTGAPDPSTVSALGSLMASAPAVPANHATHALGVGAPVGSSGFAKELGQQITWLSGQDIKQAQIRLNPQQLGPLEVKISVEHGRVDVSFMAQHPATAAAVQQGLDQLHQMLGGQGLSLGHASVGQHAQQQFAGQPQPNGLAEDAGNDGSADTPIATAARVAIGLVDAFV
jgi:flagellar hook-length control protein FliK